MALVKNISHSPSDKRGLGLTFLGMMNKDDTPSPLSVGDFISRTEFDNALFLMRAEIEALRIRVNTPWYKRLFNRIKRMFKG